MVNCTNVTYELWNSAGDIINCILCSTEITFKSDVYHFYNINSNIPIYVYIVWLIIPTLKN